MSETRRRHGEMTDTAPYYAGPPQPLLNGRALPDNEEAYQHILATLWREQGPKAHLTMAECDVPLDRLPLKRWLHVEICPVCRGVFEDEGESSQ